MDSYPEELLRLLQWINCHLTFEDIPDYLTYGGWLSDILDQYTENPTTKRQRHLNEFCEERLQRALGCYICSKPYITNGKCWYCNEDKDCYHLIYQTCYDHPNIGLHRDCFYKCWQDKCKLCSTHPEGCVTKCSTQLVTIDELEKYANTTILH